MNNSRAGILVVISGFLFHVIFFGFILNYNVMYLGLQNHFNSTEIETGIPGYVSYGIFSLATPLSTVFFTLTNHRTVVITGVILCCASLVISALVASIYILIFSFGVLFGLGANFFHIPSLHILIYYYSGKRYNQACVAVSTGVGAGILVSSLLLEKMFIEFGLKNTFLIYGGCALCIGLLLSITMVVPRQDNDETKTVSDSYLVVKEAETVIERDVKQGDNSNNVNLISDVKPTEISRDESECTFVREDEPLPSSPTVDKRETSNLMGGRKDFENGSTSSHIDKTTAIKKNTKFNSLKLFLDMIKTVNFWLCFPMFMLFYIAIPFSLVSLSSFMSERGIASHVIVRTLSLMGVIDLATRSTF
ncbi:monocarboxylate transporter 9-like isoform X2 [Antedon mediterranea]|uniref:monocarboxylate transporter 9-like isoform X2 n=1 Tax=Antedon mediterranea TaxID=105859 RepID=UPI003AF7E608